MEPTKRTLHQLQVDSRPVSGRQRRNLPTPARPPSEGVDSTVDNHHHARNHNCVTNGAQQHGRTRSNARRPSQKACIPQFPSSGTLVKWSSHLMPVAFSSKNGSTGSASWAARRASAVLFWWPEREIEEAQNVSAMCSRNTPPIYHHMQHTKNSLFALSCFSTMVLRAAPSDPPLRAHRVLLPVNTTMPTTASVKTSWLQRGNSCLWSVVVTPVPSQGRNTACWQDAKQCNKHSPL